MSIQILILQRGWVAVGRFSQDGSNVTLTDASVIRRWGTTNGIGELVAGPTAKTILDRVGTLRAHELAVVGRIECDAAAWESLL